MSGGMAFDTKEQVKQAIDIVDLVGGHIRLRRQGRNFVGLCPWHDDTKPSLQVNPERQSFKCWVCDIGGDVFSFVMKMEGVEFREALKMLADRAGIAIERPRPPRRTFSGDSAAPGDAPDEYYGVPAAAPAEFDKHTLYRAMHWAEKQYHDCLLQSPQAEAGRKYLFERGISTESIEKFHLGFSPLDRDWILQQVGKGSASRNARQAANRAKILEAIGILARPAEGGSYYDRFKGRLLFSIRDSQGRPVGIGGRVLPELGTTSPAKYVNSPETPLFTKSKLLYGLDMARDTVRKSRQALVMEGYTDVIVAHQYGFTGAVAVLGTALGSEHIKILKHYTDHIVLVLDGDEAGQKRTNEVLELFVAEQVDLRILTLPAGLDPCDFLHERGPEAFQYLLEHQTIDAFDHAFQTATRGVDVERDVHAASQALERLVAIVAKAPRLRANTSSEDRFREEKILQRLAATFRIDEREVRERLTALRRHAQSRGAMRSAAYEQGATELSDQNISPETLDACQKGFLEILLAFPESFAELRERLRPDWLGGGSCRAIFEICRQMDDEGIPPTFDRLMTEFDDPAMKNLLVEYDEAGQSKGLRDLDYHILVSDLLKIFERKEIEKRRPVNVVELREGAKDPLQDAEKLEQILNQERRRQGITKFTEEQGP
ncbi:MAG: DNA primase [Pirellulales bacterium]|nr:DNA primase [Pirellulales bacterium]